MTESSFRPYNVKIARNRTRRQSDKGLYGFDGRTIEERYEDPIVSFAARNRHYRQRGIVCQGLPSTTRIANKKLTPASFLTHIEVHVTNCPICKKSTPHKHRLNRDAYEAMEDMFV